MLSNWMGKLVAGYVRSSVEGEDGRLSVSAQKQMMEQCAAEAGAQVSNWYVDLGYSGRSMERPAFQSLLAAGQSGEPAFDVVLVWKWSRLSCNIEDLCCIEETLRKAGIDLVPVSEPGDSSASERYRERLMEAFENGMLDLDRLKTWLRRIEAACQRRLQGE